MKAIDHDDLALNRYPSLAGARRWIPFFALSLAAVATLPGAEAPPPVGNWGKWGPEDQKGTLNYITPEVVLHALGLVRQGKTINLSVPFAPGHPTGLGPDRTPIHYMRSTAQNAGKSAGVADDDFVVSTHGTTHWDGLPHFHAGRKIYNGFDVQQFVTPRGAARAGIEHAADSLATRGVLLDVARARGVSMLSRDTLITVADLEETARRQKVTFRPGDAILIHTGFLNIWYKEGRAAYYGGHPGIAWEVTQWLKKNRAAAFGIDTQDIDKRPAPVESMTALGYPSFGAPIHVELLRNQGMLVCDIIQLSDLAADCAADGIYEFLFVGPPLVIKGGTGSPLNPMAIK